MILAMAAQIAVSSVVGSVHCIAMCGPLVGLHSGARTVRLALIHSLGRLTTYTALGIGAGAIGSALDVAGHVGAVQKVAMLIAGLAILTWGCVALATALGLRLPRLTKTSTAFTQGLLQIRTQRPATRVWLIGVLTGLLPCGWLWAFVVVAGGTGHWWSGGLLMVAFWLGTVPAMVGVLAFAGPLLDRIRTRLPLITAMVLISLGVGTLTMRWHDIGQAQVTHPSCHCHQQEATS